QLVFRGITLRRLDEYRLNAVASELFDEENLVGVFATEPVGSVDEDGLKLPFGSQSRRRSSPGRTKLAPLKPSSSKTHSRGTSYPSLWANSVNAAVWLAIVFSSFCLSDDTLA